MVDGGTFILPDEPESSGFLAILTVGSGPTLMPPPEMEPPMSDTDVAVVSAWIFEGAQDN